MDFDATADELLQRLEAMARSATHMLVNDLTKGEVFLLNHLLSSQGVARSSELAAAMGTSTARVSAAVNSMVRKGWVYRKGDESDHRKTLVHLTPDGLVHIRQIRKQALAGLKSLLIELGEEDTAEYLRITGKLNDIAAQMQQIHNATLS